jgi:DNA-binding response OmpR family regulator
MKILVADDDLDLLGLVAYSLSQAGYLVVKASDGPGALATFEAEAPDLVILDINMPGTSGFEVCTAIRARGDVPVMMLTARGEEQDLVKALDLGADDYLTKPFSPKTLLARVKALRPCRTQPDAAVGGPRGAGSRELHRAHRGR